MAIRCLHPPMVELIRSQICHEPERHGCIPQPPISCGSQPSSPHVEGVAQCIPTVTIPCTLPCKDRRRPRLIQLQQGIRSKCKQLHLFRWAIGVCVISADVKRGLCPVVHRIAGGICGQNPERDKPIFQRKGWQLAAVRDLPDWSKADSPRHDCCRCDRRDSPIAVRSLYPRCGTLPFPSPPARAYRCTRCQGQEC